MKKLSLNFKKIALSLLVVGLAVGSQSFKNAENKVAENDIYVTLDGNQYTYLPSGYDPLKCIEDEAVPCSFTLTEEGALHIERIDTFTAAQLNDYQNVKGWIMPLGTRTGVYDPN